MDSTIESILRQDNLKNYAPRPESKGIAALRAANMRWVVIQNDYPSLAQFSETFSNKWREIKIVMPVYNEQGQGPESAASPLPDVVVAKFRAGSEEKMIDYFKRETGLAYNQVMSNLLKPFYYFNIKPEEQIERETEGQVSNAFDIIEKLSGMSDIDIVEYDWLKLETYMEFIPDDVLWPNQWNMVRISMPNAWHIQQGVANVWIAIIDSGFDLAHPDLLFTPNIVPNLTHFNADDALMGNPPPYNAGPSGVPHGTSVAGIAAATVNNALGVAGLAGGCSIMPIRLGTEPTADRVAAGINWAVNNGARVASMSLGTTSTAALITAINNAWTSGLVLCAASGNDAQNASSPPVGFPASHTNVIAVGASDQADQRKRPASADAECWGSHYGPELGVMAPGVLCWTTDEQGQNGYNKNNGGAVMDWGGCVNYASCGDAAGDYLSIFNGTSAATPHVSGLAALILSLYPTLTNQQVRDITERTCDKINPAMYPYADDLSHSNGTWYQETGYGRINAFRALDFADVLIKDWSGDMGVEPSSPPGGDFWDFSDIVIKPIDDNVFVPDDPSQSSNVERGQTNYLYIRVTNNGPNEARNVAVDARITPYVGLEFVYTTDWTAIDATHIRPSPLPLPSSTIPAGGSIIAKFEISSAQVDELWGWVSNQLWHPCILASVDADNDYAFATSNITGSGVITRRNNLAQHNLNVVNYLSGNSYSFPFIAANLQNPEKMMEIVIERLKLPEGLELLLSFEEDENAFPTVDFKTNYAADAKHKYNNEIVILERTKIEMMLGSCRGVLTLEKGSKFNCSEPKVGTIDVNGGEIILRKDKKYVNIVNQMTSIRIEKQPGQLYPMSLQMTVPKDAKKDEEYMIRISQRNQMGVTVGGATLIARIRHSL